MESLSEALQYPTDRDDWYRAIVIGGVLAIFSFLIIPIFLVYGYLIRVIQARLANEAEPPVFEEWVELLVTGLKAFVIGIVYMLIPMIVAGLTVGGAILAFATGTEVGAGLGIMGLLGGMFLTFILALVFGYVAVAAVVNFARSEEIGDAFDFGTIKAVVLDSRYAIGWVSGVVVLLAAGVIGGMLNVVPLIGAVIAAFVYFYAQVVAASLWADGVQRAGAAGETGRSVSADDTAA